MNARAVVRGRSTSRFRADQEIRVLIVDDQKLFAEALQGALERKGMTVIGVTPSGEEAVFLARRTRPDIVLLDLGLPGAEGLEVGRMILGEVPGTSLLALTEAGRPNPVKEVLRAGFQGYVTKDVPISQLFDSIVVALERGVVLPRGLSPKVSPAKSSDAERVLEELTPREREILAMLVGGWSGHEIAQSLSISRNTVRAHVQSILTKLQVHSRLEAVALAVRHGMTGILRGSD
jgi:two-component system, NarL family, nitrate/nitrite response regulator NarL